MSPYTFTAPQTDDVTTSERRRREIDRPERGDDCRSGVDEHSEEVLPRHLGAQLYVPEQRLDDHQRAEPDEHDDGAAQVLQPSLPHQRYDDHHCHQRQQLAFCTSFLASSP